MYLEYSDVILRHSVSVVASRSECDTQAKLGVNTFAVPVVASNMKSIITPEICKVFDNANWFYVYHRIDGAKDVYNFANNAERNLSITSISVGVKQEWVDLVKELKENSIKVDYFTVDVALSYSENILKVLKTIKTCYPNAYVICGNGATADWVRWIESFNLIDCIKVGIGVSKACRTRQYTGFGSTTLGSLIECVKVSSGDIMSDGGLTIEGDTVCIGDIAKAIAFGADWVMSGSLFSKCIDSPALINGYYGNASREAKGHNHVEGTLIEVKSNGLTIKEMMRLIQDSLKSSISYAGGTKIGDLFKTPYDMKGDFAFGRQDW